MTLSGLSLHIVRPILRRSPLGIQNRVMNLLGASDPHHDRGGWEASEKRYRVLHDDQRGTKRIVDLAEWSDRAHYFTGEYFDATNTALLQWFLRPGDTMIDVGANFGVHTLHACRLVGPEGRVMSFEPNPRTYERLRGNISLNGFTNVETFPFGLGAEDLDGTLWLANEHLPGSATLRGGHDEAARQAGHEVQVQVRRADSAVHPDDARGSIFVKIDTEGYEAQVVRGLEPVLRAWVQEDRRLLVSVEVTDEWLRVAGSSSDEMFQWFKDSGMTPYKVHCRRRQRPQDMLIEPLDQPDDEFQYDAVFVAEGVRAELERLRAAD